MIKSCHSLVLLTVFAAYSLHAQETKTYLFEAKQFYGNVSANLLQSAEEMPEQGYSFRPTPTSPTFGQLIREATVSQMNVCSAIEGKRPPSGGLFAPTKNELVEGLQSSITTCGAAYDSVNNFTASQMVNFGSAKYTKLALMFLNANRDNELCGNLAVYLRLNGLVPPANHARLIPVD